MSPECDAQVCKALQVLLSRVGLEVLWGDDGPTKQAREYYEHGFPRGHSPTDVVMLQAAFALWKITNDKLSFARVVEDLDANNARALFGLVEAYMLSASAVDAWIQVHSHKGIR
jgi:hypothetical protein